MPHIAGDYDRGRERWSEEEKKLSLGFREVRLPFSEVLLYLVVIKEFSGSVR